MDAKVIVKGNCDDVPERTNKNQLLKFIRKML